VRLHRLILRNYRGIENREIVLPDSGVIVVSGANEIGKSSMIEAIDLLLDAKDRSAKKEVKQVKPTHADVGAEVTAEISCGPYRFVYRKRFHNKCETELTVLAPRREQLTGDEAHERVRMILAETVDTDLWRAQRVLQSASTAPVDLSGCDALSRALDVAAGQSAALSGNEPVLVDRIDAEYLRYFTSTGRSTGEWAAATDKLTQADAEVARCTAALAEVDDCVRRHAEMSAALAELAAARAAANQRLTKAHAAADAVAELTAELKEAEVILSAATATADASAAAISERQRLDTEVENRVRAVAELDARAADAAENESIARAVHDDVAAAAERSAATLQQAQVRAEAARVTFDRLSDRDEANRLAARLVKVDAARRDLETAEQQINTSLVTDAVLRDIEVAVAAVERASNRAELASVHIELTASTDIDVRVQGRMISLAAEQTFTTSASTSTDVEVPGVLRARVVPGTPVCDTHATLEAAQAHLRGLLEAVAAADVGDARGQAERRRELVSGRDRLTATLSGLCGDEPEDELRSRLAALHDRENPGDEPGLDAASARAALEAAIGAHRDAVAVWQRDRDVAAAAATSLTERCTRAAVLQESLTIARTELDAGRERLAQQRATVSDEDLQLRARTNDEASARATARVSDVRSRLTEIAPERVGAELGDAERNADELTRGYDAIAAELRDLTTQLRLYGTEGRKGRLDAAQAEREQTASEHGGVGRRARAAALLRSVILRHRDDTRLRYVKPFRAEVERLGRIVFGDTFQVEIDSSLQICSRTLAGRTVSYESLSGGAKEQLGIIARLAAAALVAKEDGVPVIIDDALGFTDSDRLAKMGAVFDAVGSDAQLLVLTCSPGRYDCVEGAHRIELTA
jgi:AAA ATPase-like protein